MSVLVKNECGVQTILPMSLECNVVNATTPQSLDGTIYLNITGGSTPYTITWNNGSNTQNLYSISAGTYTATVVDYYGDYTATTTCTVESEQFYVDYFVDCGNEYNVYLTGLTNTYDVESIYKLSANTGCWIYSGKTLNGTNELSFDNIIEGPYDTCLECDPPITPPYFPELLCLSTQSPYTTYQFEFYGFYNNRPTYTGTSANSVGFTIEWLTGSTNQWKVVGKSGNTLTNGDDTYNPLGAWSLNGTQQVWNAVSGSCPTIPDLTATHSTSDPSCENSCNGSSVVVTASGGISPYQFSFDGGAFSALPSKTALCPGQHNYDVLDSSGNTYSGSFVINKGPKVNNYTISLTYKNVDTQTNYGTQVGKRLEYYINVTPTLPDGVEITLPLSVSVKKYTSKPGQTDVTYTPYLFSGTTSLSATTNSLTNTQIIKPNAYAYNYPYEATATTYNVSYSGVKLKKGLVVSGYVDTLITKVSNGTPSCSCKPFKVYNPSTSTQFYRWTNCTGGTETSFNVAAKQTTNICACSVSKGSSSGANDGNSLIITEDGVLNCAGAVTDGNITVSAGMGAASINENCSAIKIQTPSSNQLYSQLYQFNSGGIQQ